MKSCVAKTNPELDGGGLTNTNWTVIPRSPAFWDNEESTAGLLKRWSSGNPNKIPPFIRPDSIGSHSVGMTSRSTLRHGVTVVKCFSAFDLNGVGEFSVLDIDLSREMHIEH
ncbi:MAG: hypothetical protein ACLP05_11380 [Candidatus Kryptoniota bacterium]